ERGGNTGFANMYAAYDALPGHLKAALVGTRGIFLAGRNNADRSFKRTLSAAQKAKTPPVSHPIVRTHPETGRRCIFANEQHTVAIEGMEESESADVLAQLFAHNKRTEFCYFHDWRVGDLTFWDNRCAQHIADHTRLDDPSYIRHMHRTTIEGDTPI
ncbi:MAG: TauD/TfdA family dioxygenase, partial [Pseudomonadota bacterium]